jgi:sugar transferase EpsL
MMEQRGWRLAVKRVADTTLAIGALVVTAPLLAVSMAGTWATMGRPLIFVQTRPGRHGRPFRLYKLRTMTQVADGDGRLQPDAIRLTPWGRLLRSLSLDELPQLFNVLRGDMSLVGPRPLLMQYLERYTPEQARRHEVLPGLTGWAQVNGRNAVGWDQRFALDIWYVEHWTLALDLRILGLTLLSVARREGISSNDHATMAEFMGTGGPPS